jgi:5'-3' exonuclease
MILIDNNQIMIACLYKMLKESSDMNMDMFRILVLESYRYYRNKFYKNYGELIICHDNRNYWRKDIFSNYKSNRKKAREKSDMDWDKAYKMIHSLLEELEKELPYKHLEVEKTEADDIIAVITKHNYVKEDILIISSDKDFQQLQRYPNVKQYSPHKDEFMVCENPEHFLIDHIIRGDSSDGIPNILSDDDAIINKEKRQNSCRKNIVEDIFNNLDEWSKKDNWKRNQSLVDLNFIPEEYENKIIKEYEKPIERKRNNLLNYFIEHKLKIFMENIEDF